MTVCEQQTSQNIKMIYFLGDLARFKNMGRFSLTCFRAKSRASQYVGVESNFFTCCQKKRTYEVRKDVKHSADGLSCVSYYFLPVIHGVDVLENVTIGRFEEDVSK